MKYIAKEKSFGLWYVEGPGWGEPADKFCESEESAKISAARMNMAYERGYSDHQSLVTRKMNTLFDLGIDD